jgi:essential nuclear protein 1
VLLGTANFGGSDLASIRLSHRPEVPETFSNPPYHDQMPRAAKSPGKSRHDPLLVQLREDEAHNRYGRVSQPGRRGHKKGRAGEEDDGDADESAAVLDTKTSRRIFELARDQQVELGVLDDDEDVSSGQEEDNSPAHRPRAPPVFMGDEEDEEEELEYEEYEIDAEDEFVSL